jgi:NAD(P)-dependent dehydrogenase (short-subunit alcohol dehydrogenase family)
VNPGTILTEMTRGRLWNDRPTRHQILSRTPLGRFGTVEEVAALVAFLVSEDASFLTAQAVTLDGGRNALNYTVPVVED